MTTDLQSRVARFGQNEENVDAWAKGDETHSVDFGGGPVMSPARLIYLKNQEINEAADGLLHQSTLNAAVAAAGASAASALANAWPNVVLGLQNTAEGRFFSTPSEDPKESAVIYQKVDGMAIEGAHIASASGASQDLIDMASSIARIATVVIQNNAFT